MALLPELITSQRGHEWHCYIGRLISKGKMRFPPLGLEKTMNILQSNLQPNLVQIGCEMAPPHGGEV